MKASKTLRAPAKLNLTLEVLQRRADGLHGLRSVMVPVDLCDDLILAPAAAFAFECSRSDLQHDNLVERALHAIAPEKGVSARLVKRIPTGAGMGGGSSDAAAVLLAAADGAFGPVEIDYLQTARSLGSDVPFFLAQTAALVEGTGERVTALGAMPPWHAVVVQPPVAVSTAWAYEQLDKAQRPARARNESASIRMSEALQRADFEAVVDLQQNDFHGAIAASDESIGLAVRLLERAGARRALLTGSGSCVYALAKTRDDREALAARMDVPEGFGLFTCAFYTGAAWRSAA